MPFVTPCIQILCSLLSGQEVHHAVWNSEVLIGLVDWITRQLAIQSATDADKIQIIIAFFAAVTAFATAGLFLFAGLQVLAIRAENRKWETVKATNAIDTDPILHRVGMEIREAARNGTDYSPETMKSQTYNIMTILNALDALAIGVEQGVYVESVVTGRRRASCG